MDNDIAIKTENLTKAYRSFWRCKKILPDLKNFSVGKYFVDGINIPYKTVFMSFGYAVLYACFCLPISFVVFKRRLMKKEYN